MIIGEGYDLVKKKPFLIMLPIVVFTLMVTIDRFFNKKNELLVEDPMSLKIDSNRKYKNALILNDTIAIFRKSYRVFPKTKKHYSINYFKYIESLEVPYYLYKERNNDTLKVILKKDTLYYKLVPF